MLAAFGEQWERFPGADALQRYAGLAPVTERSGHNSWVHWRWACPTFLRQTFAEWTGETIPRSFGAKASYDRKRASGASHNAAIRALALKWVRILFRYWVDRVPCDKSQYLSALQEWGSPVLKVRRRGDGLVFLGVGVRA